MNELLVMVPTRGRPHNVRRFTQAFKDTAQLPAHLLFITDEDDRSYDHLSLPAVAGRLNLPRAPVSAKVNHAAMLGIHRGFKALMFLGDDNVCVTPGWDAAIVAHLEAMGSGMVSVNDLGGEHQRVATNMAITADIVQALGWFDEPSMCHYYVDNVWTELGREADCLDYAHDVVIEHRHPIYRKDPPDAVYAETMTRYWNVDTAAYHLWVQNRKQNDLSVVRKVVGRSCNRAGPSLSLPWDGAGTDSKR